MQSPQRTKTALGAAKAAGGKAGGKAVAAASEAYRLSVACKCVPAIQDMVADRVASRWLTTFVWATIAVFVLRSVLAVLVLPSPTRPPSSAPDSIRLQQSATAPSSEVGQPFSPPLAARRTLADGSSGVFNSTIRAALVIADSEAVWDERFGLEGTPIAAVGIPVGLPRRGSAGASLGQSGGRFALPGFVPDALKRLVLQGSSSSTSASGVALFSSARPVLALPGTYFVQATAADDSNVFASGQRAIVSSSVAHVAVDGVARSAVESRAWTLGEQLPSIRVRVSDTAGAPLSNKVCVALSAPRSIDEFVGLLSRPDVLWPRMSRLAGGVSEASDSDGFAVFNSLAVNSSSSETALVRISCDGVLGPGLSSGADLAVRLWSPPLRVEVVEEPAEAVLEGRSLTSQPAVRVLMRNCTMGYACGPGVPYVPAIGIRVYAAVQGRDGATFHTPLDGDQAEQLGYLGGGAAIPANVARAKSLTGFESQPTDANGVATWADLGFIRHGPAGKYRLAMLVLGRFTRTQWIRVRSSVATVRMLEPLQFDEDVIAEINSMSLLPPSDVEAATAWARRTDTTLSANSTVCNAPHAPCPPVVATSDGARYGSVFYQQSATKLLEQCGLDKDEELVKAVSLFPRMPSGALTLAPGVLVLDSENRPLAGKVSEAVVIDRTTRERLPGFAVEEFPFRGSTKTGLGGVARYFAASADVIIGSERGARAQETDDAGSFFRVVTAPHGPSRNSAMALVVEGVESQEAMPLEVLNSEPADALATCAHLTIESMPSNLTSNPLGLHGAPWRVRATNAAGEPVAGVNVSMHAVAGAGAILFPSLEPRLFMAQGATLEDGLRTRAMRMEQMDDPSWRATRLLGGMAAYAMGNVATSWLAGEGARGLYGPVDSAVTNADGIAEFHRFSTVTFSTSTFVRFGFISRVNLTVGTPPPDAPLYPETSAWAAFRGARGDWWEYPSDAACVSQVSRAVPLHPLVSRVGTQGTPSETDVQQTGWGAEAALKPPLEYQLEDAAGDPLSVWGLSEPPGSDLLVVVDPLLASFPASVFAGSLPYSAFPGLPSMELSRSDFAVRGIPWDSSYFGDDDWLPNAQDSERTGRSAYPITNYMVPEGIGIRQNDFRGRFIQLNGVRTIRASLNLFVEPEYGALSQMLAQDGEPVPEVVWLEGGSPATGNVSMIPGFAGRYRFTLASMGSVSAASPALTFTETGVQHLLAFDYGGFAAALGTTPPVIAEPGPGGPVSPPLCPRNHLTELSKLLACPGNCSAASGKGLCVCGTCVCAAGWDGAVDCSEQVSAQDAATSLQFGSNPEFGGMPVVDLAAPMSRDVRLAMDVGLDEPFPRILLGFAVQAGRWVADANASEPASGRRLESQAPSESGHPKWRGHPPDRTGQPWASLADASRELLRGAGPDDGRRDSAHHWDEVSSDGQEPPADFLAGLRKATLGGDAATESRRPRTLAETGAGGEAPWQRAGWHFEPVRTPGHFSAMPVLVRCTDGQVEPSAYFLGWDAPISRTDWNTSLAVQSDAGLDRCGSVPLPVFSAAVNASYGLSTSDYFRRLYRVDRRLRLVAPPGCYRVVWAFGLDAGGRAGGPSARLVTPDLARAAAVSQPLRPFRVLGPVRHISAQANTSTGAVQAARGVAMPVAFAVKLATRNPAGATSPLQEMCVKQHFEFCDVSRFGSANREAESVSRCPTLPARGLIVKVSAVSTSSGAEFPLFSRSAARRLQFSDCALAAVDDASSSADARFEHVMFPADSDSPPIPDGEYKLQFSAYGISKVLASPLIRLTSSPSRLALVGSANRQASVGTPLAPAVSALAQLVAVQDGSAIAGGSDTLTVVPGAVASAVISWGPINSNAKLESLGSSAVSSEDGVLSWPQLTLSSGIPGVYEIDITSAATGSQGQTLQVAVASGLGDVHLTHQPFELVEQGRFVFPEGAKVCVKGLQGEALPGQVLVAAFHLPVPMLRPEQCTIPSSVPGQANGTWNARQVSAAARLPAACFAIPDVDLPHFARPFGPQSNRTRVAAALSVDTLTTEDTPDGRGCANLDQLTLPTLPFSGPLDLTFQLVQGVHPGAESKPARLNTLTLADKQAAVVTSIASELTSRIVLPALLVVPLLWANTAYIGSTARLWLWGLAAAVSAPALLVFAFIVFPDDTEAARAQYSEMEVLPLVAMDVGLGIFTIATLLAQLVATWVVFRALQPEASKPLELAPWAARWCSCCLSHDRPTDSAEETAHVSGLAAMMCRCCCFCAMRRPAHGPALPKSPGADLSGKGETAVVSALRAPRGAASDRGAVAPGTSVLPSPKVRAADSESSSADTSVSRSGHTGFYGWKLANAVAFTRRRAPKLVAPLVAATGQPTTMFVEALADVFLRFASSRWSSLDDDNVARSGSPLPSGGGGGHASPAVRSVGAASGSEAASPHVSVQSPARFEGIESFDAGSVRQGSQSDTLLWTARDVGTLERCCGAALRCLPCGLLVTRPSCLRRHCLMRCAGTRVARLEMEMAPDDIDRFVASLLALHTGLEASLPLKTGLAAVLGTSLSSEAMVAIFNHRLVKLGVARVCHDFLRLARALDFFSADGLPSPQKLFAGLRRGAKASASSPAAAAAPHPPQGGSGARPVSPGMTTEGARFAVGLVGRLARVWGRPSLTIGQFVAILTGHPCLAVNPAAAKGSSLFSRELLLWLRLWQARLPPTGKGVVFSGEDGSAGLLAAGPLLRLRFRDFLGIMTARLRPIPSLASPDPLSVGPQVAVDSSPGAVLRHLVASTVSGRRPLVPDSSMWDELRGWGFDAGLGLRLVTERPPPPAALDSAVPLAGLAGPAVALLSREFEQERRLGTSGPQAYSPTLSGTATGRPGLSAATAMGGLADSDSDPQLTWTQLSTWRARKLKLGAFRRHDFALVALTPEERKMLAHEVLRGDAGQVGPVGYAQLLLLALGSGAEGELRSLFQLQGFTSRLCHQESRVLFRDPAGAAGPLRRFEGGLAVRPLASLYTLLRSQAYELGEPRLRPAGAFDWVACCCRSGGAQHRAVPSDVLDYGAGRAQMSPLRAAAAHGGAATSDPACASPQGSPAPSTRAQPEDPEALDLLRSPAAAASSPHRRAEVPKRVAQPGAVGPASPYGLAQKAAVARALSRRSNRDDGVHFALGQRVLALAALCLVFSGAGVIVAVLSETRFREMMDNQFAALVDTRLQALSQAAELSRAATAQLSAAALAAARFAQQSGSAVSPENAVAAAVELASGSQGVAQQVSDACSLPAAAGAASLLPSSPAQAAAEAACAATSSFVASAGLADAVSQAQASLNDIGIADGAASLISQAQAFAVDSSSSAMISAGVDPSMVAQLGQFTSQFLLGIDIDALRAVKDAIAAAVVDASRVALAVAMAVVWLNVFFMLRSYRLLFRDAVRGNYRLVWRNTKVGKASTLLGIAAASSLLTFLGIWIVVTLVGFAVFFAPVRIRLWNFILSVLSKLVGVSLVISITQIVVMQWIVSRGPRVLNKRLFMLGDLVLSLMNLFAGLFVSVTRLGVAISILLLNFMRVDQPLVTKAMEHKDPATAAFNGALVLDVFGSHPVLLAFAEVMASGLKARREARRRADAAAAKGASLVPTAGERGDAPRSSISATKMMWLAIVLHRGPLWLRDMRVRDGGVVPRRSFFAQASPTAAGPRAAEAASLPDH